jgi:cysteine desulfurase
MRVYFDNAATAPMEEEVIMAMTTTMREVYGNPSASHSLGRAAKGVIENCRKQVAGFINAKASEIYFTSGGTEADNMAVRCAVKDLGVKTIITSPIEHKAVLETAKELEKQGSVKCLMVDLNPDGSVNLLHLDDLATANPGSLISLMHANNEIGTLNDLEKIGIISKSHKCLFHSDTVQTMGHLNIDVKTFGIDFLSCSAHKFNGPKGTGFLFMANHLKIHAIITGGGQERNTRAGTENIYGIVGLAKAMEIANRNMADDHAKIQFLKNYLIEQVQKNISDISFNGNIIPEKSLYTVLSVSIPPNDLNEMLLFMLDLEGVCVSGGSACNSGAAKGSHVLEALKVPDDRVALRFSFNKTNTTKEIDYAVGKLRQILQNSLAV